MLATTECTFSKAPTCHALCIFNSKSASRNKAVHSCSISTSKSAPNLRCFEQFDSETCFGRNTIHLFFHISTSKNGLAMVSFYHFDFHMCFAPQRHAFCPHLNFQRCSETGLSLNFDFHMCFAAERRATFHNARVKGAQKCDQKPRSRETPDKPRKREPEKYETSREAEKPPCKRRSREAEEPPGKPRSHRRSQEAQRMTRMK